LSVALTVALVPAGEPLARVAVVGLTALHLVGGCVLAAAAALGEYVYRIYDQAKDRPVYLLKESTAEPGEPAVPLQAGRHRPPRAA
jgi:hypothetical protein